MSRIVISVLFASLWAIVACKNDHLAPDWRIDEPRILAIQADQPVFSPGDTVEFSLLLAGIDLFSRTNTTIEWGLGNVLRSVPADRSAQFDIPLAGDIDSYFGADIAGQYTATGKASVELRVVVRLADGTVLPAHKKLLLAKPSIVQSLQYQSPVIEQILVNISGQQTMPIVAGMPIYLSSSSKGNITLSADLGENSAVEVYGYRWYVESMMSAEKPTIIDGAFSPKVEIALPDLGSFIVHLIVEDRSEEVKDPLYHGGLDFVSFTVGVGADTADADAMFAEEDITDDVGFDQGPLVDDDQLLAD
ncbi:MAG TPA: hypothetical protein PLV42_11140 [bacterium]|nr:hypothetical protein [bacterium]